MSKTLFYDGIFYSGLSETNSFSYMTVENGKIVGTYKEKPHGKFKKEISLGGKHVYPCLIDAHTHMLFTIAVMAMGFNICEITDRGVEPNTLSEIEKKVRAYAATKGKDTVIAANNYIQAAVDAGRLPTREELDDWAGGRPIVIYNIDGHSTALSSAMLKLLDIDPEGHSGVLQGEDNERVQGRLTDIIAAQMTLPRLAKGIAAFQNTCAAYGISVVGALEGNGDSPKDPTTALIVRLARHFDVGVRFYFQYMDINRAKALSKFQKHPRIGGCGDWEMDGAVGAHSAALSEPYADTGERAGCYYEQDYVNSKVKEADEAGFQIAGHAIGDLAIERFLSALGGTKSGRFHRVEHGEFPSEKALEELKKGRYALMMQPGYAWIDKKYLHTYTQYMSPLLLKLPRLRTLFDSGVCVCGSSDSPVQDLDPYLQMLGMVDFYIEEESITPFEAFKSYTLNPAKALLEEEERGTLEKGKVADFFVADENLFSVEPQKIVSFRPIETYYGGKKYKKKSGSVLELLLSLFKKAKPV